MDRDGEIYVPTSQGLAHRTAAGWNMIRRTNGLPMSGVDYFLQDREGSAWIALDGGGVVRWLGYQQWETFTESEGLSHDVVWALARDSQGKLWAATQAGISRFLPQANRWEKLGRPFLNMTPALALATDRDGTLWIGQSSGGLVHLNPLTGRGEHSGLGSEPLSEWVLTMVPDSRGSIWVGTAAGLYRGTPSAAGVRFEPIPLPFNHPPTGVLSILEDSRGWLWAATSKGLCYFAGDRWRAVTTRDGLRQDMVTYMAEAPDHAIWVAYRDPIGISRLELAGDHVSANHFEPKDGRRPAKPYFLRFDRRGWLWMGTDMGLDRYDGRSWAHFDKADGMALNDCDANAFLDDSDGSIWVGTPSGLSHLLNASADSRSQDAPPVLTRVQLGGLAAPPGAELSVPYARRSLDVAFSALTFVNEESMQFRHRLLGLDDTWSETRQVEAHYPGLPPGRYRFQVQAATGVGNWSHATAEMSFTVEPPWWRRWWALLAGLLLLATATRQIWRWRVHAMIKRQQELERAVADRTRKLALEHDVALQEKARAESETQKVEKQKVEIEQLLWESRQAERVKSEFVANMSHEVRTPLNGIVGMTDLVLQSELTPDQADCLQMVKLSSDSLLAMINGVLDFSAMDNGKLSLDSVEFDLAALVEDTLKSLEDLAGAKRLPLRPRISSGLPARLIGDPARLRQVLLQLTGNAVKFTEQGFVEVAVEADIVSEGHAVVHFQVRDTGIGIPESQHAIIFEPFHQADGSNSRRYGGTGMGLAVSSRLIDLMEGRMWLESTQGAGSTFHFTARFALPAIQHAARPSVPSAIASGHSGLNILLVEDNPVNQKLARRILENQGNVVTCAGDGLQALDACQSSRFDLILMDIQMPRMDGLEATTELRKREAQLGRYTPILALTANAMQGDRGHCLAAGMDGYISKPIKTPELLQAIAAAVEAAPRA